MIHILLIFIGFQLLVFSMFMLISLGDSYNVMNKFEYSCKKSIKKWANLIRRGWYVFVNIIAGYSAYYGNVVGVYLHNKIIDSIIEENDKGCD